MQIQTPTGKFRKDFQEPLILLKEAFFFTFLLLSMLLSLQACVSRPGQSQQEEQNKDVIRNYFEQVWNKGELSNIEVLTPPEFIFHYQGQTLRATHEEHQEVVSYWLNGFPDYHVQLQDVLAEKDKVIARYYFTGTHKGEVLGIAPTGKTVKIGGMWICRVEDGQLVECWEEYDHHSLLQQLKNDSD